jgi:Zn-dependent protease
VTAFDPLTVLFFVLALVPAMILHEVSHGYVADRMGDMTPRLAGRLTLNPARHVDAFGTVVLPILLLLPYLFQRGVLPVFGYAKPMPLNPGSLKNPDRQQAWIMAAGPLVNLVLAIVGALIVRATGPGGLVGRFLQTWVFVNVLVAVFHILPIPPLDGSKLLAMVLPPRARQVFESLEPYGALFMLLIFFLLPGPIVLIVDAISSGLIGILVG